MKKVFILFGVAAIIILVIMGGGIYIINRFYSLSIADITQDEPSTDAKIARLEKHELAVGDTGLDAIKAWGNPIRKTVIDYGNYREEQWVYYCPLGHYDRGERNPYYVYVEYSRSNPDGKVTAIQY